MEINNQTLTQFRKDFAEAVKELGNKYGVDIEIGHITYESNSFHGALNVRKRGLDSAEWNWNCEQYGFKKEDFGRMFLYGHKQFKITGIKAGNKYPIQAEREDGKAFSFTPEAVKQGM